MKVRPLGRTGLRVSPICLGTMQFGWTADQETAFSLLDEAVELGCNFIDTADIYPAQGEKGLSEKILGRWLARIGRRRDDLIVATKVRGPMGEEANRQGLSRRRLMMAVRESLERLQIETIDLYQVHWPDEETPLEETLSALTDLVRSGMVRYLGCSNFPAWLLTRSLWISDVRNLCRFETLQPHYNLAHRAEFERELLPLCLDQGIGVLPYSPLAGGFLTGKYRPGAAPPPSARAGRNLARYGNERGFTIVQTLQEIAAARGATPAQVALAWLLASPVVSAAVIGANHPDQLRETAAGADLVLDPIELEKLSRASAW